MKAAIYCRVDQGGTVETQYDALEAQRIRLEQYALHHNIQIAGYYEDRGCPGHLTERPGLMRLINDCLEGLFDTVLVVNHDRLYRGNRYRPPQWPFKIWTLDQPQRNIER